MTDPTSDNHPNPPNHPKQPPRRPRCVERMAEIDQRGYVEVDMRWCCDACHDGVVRWLCYHPGGEYSSLASWLAVHADPCAGLRASPMNGPRPVGPLVRKVFPASPDASD